MPRRPKTQRVIPHNLNRDELIENKYTNKELEAYLKENTGIGYVGKKKSVLHDMYMKHQEARSGKSETSGLNTTATTEPESTPDEKTSIDEKVALFEKDYFENLKENTADPKLKETVEFIESKEDVNKAIDELSAKLKEVYVSPRVETKLEDIEINGNTLVNTNNGDTVEITQLEETPDDSLIRDLFADIDAERESLILRSTESPPDNIILHTRERPPIPQQNMSRVASLAQAVSELLFRVTTDAAQLAYNVCFQALWTFSNQQLNNFQVYGTPFFNAIAKHYNLTKNQLAKLRIDIQQSMRAWFRADKQRYYNEEFIQRFGDVFERETPVDDRTLQQQTDAEWIEENEGIETKQVAPSARVSTQIEMEEESKVDEVIPQEQFDALSMEEMQTMSYEEFQNLGRDWAFPPVESDLPALPPVPGQEIVPSEMMANAEALLNSFMGVAMILNVGYGAYLLEQERYQDFYNQFGTAHNYYASDEFSRLQSQGNAYMVSVYTSRIRHNNMTMGDWHDLQRYLQRDYQARQRGGDYNFPLMNSTQYNALQEATKEWYTNNVDSDKINERLRQAKLNKTSTDPLSIVMMNDGPVPNPPVDPNQEYDDEKEHIVEKAGNLFRSKRIEEENEKERKKEEAEEEVRELGGGRDIIATLDTNLGADIKADVVPKPLRECVQFIVIRGERKDLTALIDDFHLQLDSFKSGVDMIKELNSIVAEYGVLLYLEDKDLQFDKLSLKELRFYYDIINVSLQSLLRQIGHHDANEENGDGVKKNAVIRNVLVDISSLGLTVNDLKEGGNTLQSSLGNRARAINRSNTHITAVAHPSPNDYHVHERHLKPEVRRRIDTSIANYDLRYAKPKPVEMDIIENNLMFRPRPVIGMHVKNKLKNLLM